MSCQIRRICKIVVSLRDILNVPMREGSEFDQIITHANRIGNLVQETHIAGLSIHSDELEKKIYSSTDHPNESWYPFLTSMVLGAYRIFLLPDNNADVRRQAIRTLKFLDADILLLITKCTRIQHWKVPASYVIIRDHISLTGANPLSGPNDHRIGPRYPNMIRPYNKAWSDKIINTAQCEGVDVQNSVYGCLNEDVIPTEVRELTDVGIDVIGHEIGDDVILANHCGLPVTAFGYVSSTLQPGKKTELSIHLDSSGTQQDFIGRLLCRIFDSDKKGGGCQDRNGNQ